MESSFFPLTADETRRRRTIWESLSTRRACGSAAVNLSVVPDLQELEDQVGPVDEIRLCRTAEQDPEWDRELRTQIRSLHLAAKSRYQGDGFPSLTIPRTSYGQSQGLAERFGCALVPQPSEEGLLFPVPSVHSPEDVDHLRIRPLKECRYYVAIRYARYLYTATGGQLAVRSPIITGPIDTANYVLGSMKLMEWICDEPASLHQLLQIITDGLIDTIRCFIDAVDGHTAPDLSNCVDRGFLVCSEIRHLLSPDMYDSFEAPYLRQIGDACGPFVVHSCGSFVQSLPSLLGDSHVVMADFQTKETDLQHFHEVAKGSISMNVRKSNSVHERYLWVSDELYYRHVMAAFAEPAPLEFMIYDVDSYLRVQDELAGGPAGMFRWRPR